MNRHEFPSGGWQFFEPSTNWWAPAPVSNTFDQQVINIIKHRRANPAATAKYHLATDPGSVGNELEAFTRKRLNLPEVAPPKILPPQHPSYRPPVAGVITDIKKLAAGAGLLMEWEESGLPPAPAEKATARAATCATCPKNSSKQFGQWFTGPLSELLRRKIQRLNEMALTTPSDAQLGVCSACLCPLRLKVHTPFELIAKRFKPEHKAELDPRCWILAELPH